MKKTIVLFSIIFVLFSCENEDITTPVEVPDVVSEFRPNLSELNLFSGNLSDLIISPKAFKYELNTPLFTDYAHKQRIIALPNNTKMQYDGNGLPVFPEGTVIAKTFYYNNDERDLSLGKKIIETRVLIKLNGIWETGDYKWNNDQTEAVLDLTGSTLPVSWIDIEGNTNTTEYEIPSNQDCATCHNTFDQITPIGPKLRNLNFEINGSNQLENLINNQHLDGLTSIDNIISVPNWQDNSESLENRARAYFDVNCAHCHIPGGFCDDQSTLNLDFETPFENTNILERKNSINSRISVYQPGVSMPYIGTTILHSEGIDLLQSYLDSL